MNANLITITSSVYERWGWKSTPVVVLWWILFWPVGLVWFALSLVPFYRSLDTETRSQQRVTRLLSWYPPDWRARYGEEFSETLRDALEDGRGGAGLELNVAREGTAAWWHTPAGRRDLLTVMCWSLCWVPLAVQGVVPLIIKLSGGTFRSWFLALYLPEVLQWIGIACMITIGLVMLAVAVRGTPALRMGPAAARAD